MVNYPGNLDSVFSALADPTRRQIIERLARGPLTVGEIASGFSISQPAISRHVRILEQSRLLRREIEGRTHRLALSPEAMRDAQMWIDKQRAYWTAALDRLGEILEETPRRKRK